jgi:hypothetical protein
MLSFDAVAETGANGDALTGNAYHEPSHEREGPLPLFDCFAGHDLLTIASCKYQLRVLSILAAQ